MTLQSVSGPDPTVFMLSEEELHVVKRSARDTAIITEADAAAAAQQPPPLRIQLHHDSALDSAKQPVTVCSGESTQPLSPSQRKRHSESRINSLGPSKSGRGAKAPRRASESHGQHHNRS